MGGLHRDPGIAEHLEEGDQVRIAVLVLEIRGLPSEIGQALHVILSQDVEFGIIELGI